MIKQLISIRNEILLGLEYNDHLYIRMQLNSLDTLINNYNMKLCYCNNPTSTPFEKMKRYELKNNTHTSFMVTLCQTCNKPVFFPHDNFILATNEGTHETLNDIAQILIKWIKL